MRKNLTFTKIIVNIYYSIQDFIQRLLFKNSKLNYILKLYFFILFEVLSFLIKL